MKIPFIARTRRQSNSLVVTIPSNIAKQAKIREGDYFWVDISPVPKEGVNTPQEQQSVTTGPISSPQQKLFQDPFCSEIYHTYQEAPHLAKLTLSTPNSPSNTQQNHISSRKLIKYKVICHFKSEKTDKYKTEQAKIPEFDR